MKQRKHTPAPWRMEIIGRSQKRLYVTGSIKDESGVCCEIQMTGDSPTCEDLANARLIESAPELLAALEHAVDLLSACGTETPAIIRDALAKARK